MVSKYLTLMCIGEATPVRLGLPHHICKFIVLEPGYVGVTQTKLVTYPGPFAMTTFVSRYLMNEKSD
jgi:hypothetical protein